MILSTSVLRESGIDVGDFLADVNLVGFQFNDQSAAYDLQFLQTRAWASGSWAFDNNEIITIGKTKSHRHVGVFQVESLRLGVGQFRRPSSLFTEAQTSHNSATLNKNRDI